MYCTVCKPEVKKRVVGQTSPYSYNGKEDRMEGQEAQLENRERGGTRSRNKERQEKKKTFERKEIG